MSSKPRLAILVGSLRKDSINLKLAKAIAQLASEKFDPHFLNIANLPLYNQDLENPFPESANQLKKEIQSADAILFVTPEHNRTITAALKNAIDWASRPYGQNAFNQKPAAICGASPGAIGSACAQQHLKSILVYLNMRLMGQPEVYFQFTENSIDENGCIKNLDTEKFLKGFLDKLAAWI